MTDCDPKTSSEERGCSPSCILPKGRTLRMLSYFIISLSTQNRSAFKGLAGGFHVALQNDSIRYVIVRRTSSADAAILTNLFKRIAWVDLAMTECCHADEGSLFEQPC